MAGEFTSWCDILTALKDRLASGDNMTGEVSRGDKRVVYRSVDEFWKLLDRIQSLCDSEQGLSVRRTYAKQGGRGV